MSDHSIKQELKRIFKAIEKWKHCPIYAWHVGDEHIHLYLSIPPKYSVSYIVQVFKGKSSSWLKKKTKKFPQGTLWNRGYFVTTIGLNEMAVKKYVENQSHHQVELVQQKFKWFA